MLGGVNKNKQTGEGPCKQTQSDSVLVGSTDNIAPNVTLHVTASVRWQGTMAGTLTALSFVFKQSKEVWMQISIINAVESSLSTSFPFWSKELEPTNNNNDNSNSY